jgi:hypothetical protein
MGILSLSLFFLFVQDVQAPPSAVVSAGTRVAARLESAVRTDRSNVGDPVTAIVAEPIRAAGRIVVPNGSRLIGRVETVEAGSDAGEGRVRLVFREIDLPDGRTISTWITNAFSASPPKRGRRYVLFMSAGAALGAVVGGTKARTAGVLGGLIGGVIIATNTGDKPANLELKSGDNVQLELREDLRL